MSGIATPLDPALVPPEAPEAPAPGVGEGEGQDPTESTPEERRRRRRILLLFLLLGALLVLIGLIIWYLLFRQPISLPLPNTIVLPGYTTSLYGASNPIGVAANGDGSRIYVAESAGERAVRIFDAAGVQVGLAKPGADTGAEHVPLWIAIDPLTNQLYVSDRPSGAVYVYDADGVFQRTYAPAVPLPGWQPVGLAFDATGNLYVVDLAGATPRVEMFDRNGALVRTFGEGDALSFPNGIAVDAAGNVFVADSNNGRLLAYRPDGSLIGLIGRGVDKGKLGMPRGVAVDGRNRVYVGDNTGQGVEVLQIAGNGSGLEHLGFFGTPGVADGQFAFPNGVAVDGRGRLYIADSANDRVQMWSY